MYIHIYRLVKNHRSEQMSKRWLQENDSMDMDGWFKNQCCHCLFMNNKHNNQTLNHVKYHSIISVYSYSKLNITFE
jgi:hypothetical protein